MTSTPTTSAGVHRIQCLLARESDIGALALEHAGYVTHRGMVFYERVEPVHPASAGVLGQLGGLVTEFEQDIKGLRPGLTRTAH